MKKILFLASMSISMLAIAIISSCSENKMVTSDSEGEATSLTRSPLGSQQQTILLGSTDGLRTRLRSLKTGESYVWSSDNPSVITVDQEGVVTGVANGTANIQVKRLNSQKVEQESETFVLTVTHLVSIPDGQFKAYLLGNANINKNGNSEIEPSEAISFNGEIDVKNDPLIKSLDGLRFFKNLKRLNCSNTLISYLDVSANTALESLDCSKCKELIGSVPETKMANMLDLSRNLRLTAVDGSQTEKLKAIAISAALMKQSESWIKDEGEKFAIVAVGRSK